jgi:hypothetical protein
MGVFAQKPDPPDRTLAPPQPYCFFREEMPMRVLLGILVVMIVVVCGVAADISAKWSGTAEIKTPEGEIATLPFWADLRQNGQDITGTAGGGDSDESSPVEKGVFDGKKLEFQFAGPDGRVYKANLAPVDSDRLEGTLDFALPDGTPLIAKVVLKLEKKA